MFTFICLIFEQNNMQNEGMSKKLVEMLAKQELIRQSLEEFKDKMSNKEAIYLEDSQTSTSDKY